MPVANDIQGKVFRHGSAVCMARIVNAAGQVLTRASVASLEYTVYELSADDPSGLVPVTGHNGVALTVSTVVFDSLQNDGGWTVDAVGYNFRHELNVATNEAFASAGKVYQVRYELTPVLGQKIVFRFQLRCI
jgi:hypothetical protein